MLLVEPMPLAFGRSTDQATRQPLGETESLSLLPDEILLWLLSARMRKTPACHW
jgi:hypothetical protein